MTSYRALKTLTNLPYLHVIWFLGLATKYLHIAHCHNENCQGILYVLGDWQQRGDSLLIPVDNYRIGNDTLLPG